MIAGRELVLLRVHGSRALETLRAAQTARPVHAAPRHRAAARELARLAAVAGDAWIAWCDVRVERCAAPPRDWPALVRHPLEILHAGAAQGMARAAADLGRVDFSSPFLVEPPRDRRYPTWLGGSWAGIGRAAVLRAARIDASWRRFDAALLEALHAAQQGGACCYAEPRLLQRDPGIATPPLAPHDAALLVRRLRSRKWVWFWLLARALSGRNVPLAAALRAVLAPARPSAAVDPWPALHARAGSRGGPRAAIDVVLPTLARPRHVEQVLDDLARQTLPPARVVVIEQGAVDDAAPAPPVGRSFPVERIRVVWRGAGRARNLGLARTRSPWVLFVDDDVRLRPDLLAYLVETAHAYRVDAVTGAVHLPDQPARAVAGAPWPRPWGSFAGGMSLVSRAVLDGGVRFDERLDAGYGEDVDFGLSLRAAGANVLYAPACPSLHLKAPSGGYRARRPLPWSGAPVEPRPSPTVLLSRKKHHTPEMLAGYRLYYSLRRLRGARPWNVWRRWRRVSEEWTCSDRWTGRLA